MQTAFSQSVVSAFAPPVVSGDAVAEVRRLYLEQAQSLRSALARLTWPGADVDDLLQEVFVVALRRPLPLLQAEVPRAWLYGVAVKVAAAARRKHRVRQFLGLEQAAELASDASPLHDVERQQTVARVHAALARLTDKKREVLVLFELEGCSGPDIAAALGCPLKTVWTRLHHGRKDFQAALARQQLRLESRHG